ncbi:MAG TPA: hypothetical protein VIQ30_10000 [Pseudonocardia sp.]
MACAGAFGGTFGLACTGAFGGTFGLACAAAFGGTLDAAFGLASAGAFGVAFAGASAGSLGSAFSGTFGSPPLGVDPAGDRQAVVDRVLGLPRYEVGDPHDRGRTEACATVGLPGQQVSDAHSRAFFPPLFASTPGRGARLGFATVRHATSLQGRRSVAKC